MVGSRLLSHGCAPCHLSVVIVQEQPQAVLVHRLRLAERERLADEPSQSLTQRVVEAFYMVGLAAALAARRVLPLRHHLLIGFPEVREGRRVPQSPWHPLPEQPAGLLAPVAEGVGDDLARPAAQSQPNPLLVLISCSCAGRRMTRVHRVPARHRAGPGPASR